MWPRVQLQEQIILILLKLILLQTFSPRASLIKGDFVRIFTKLFSRERSRVGLH
jgi:hypothetical protein